MSALRSNCSFRWIIKSKLQARRRPSECRDRISHIRVMGSNTYLMPSSSRPVSRTPSAVGLYVTSDSCRYTVPPNSELPRAHLRTHHFQRPVNSVNMMTNVRDKLLTSSDLGTEGNTAEPRLTRRWISSSTDREISSASFLSIMMTVSRWLDRNSKAYMMLAYQSVCNEEL